MLLLSIRGRRVGREGDREISSVLKLQRVSALLLLPTGEVGKGRQFSGALESHSSLFLLLQPKALAGLAFLPSPFSFRWYRALLYVLRRKLYLHWDRAAPW